MDRRGKLLAFLIPIAIAVAGVFWIDGATEYYKSQTGRQFYQLAGYHYTIPNDGFRYHPGGEQIERWTVGLPPNVIALVFLASVLAVSFALRREGIWFVFAVISFHAIVFICFAFFVAWYSINIEGIFI